MMTGACLKGRKGLVTLLVGTVLGLSLGCALTLTYSIKLSSGVSYREDFDRLPRMALESTDKTRLDIVQEDSQSPSLNSSPSPFNLTNSSINSTDDITRQHSSSFSSPQPVYKRLYLVMVVSTQPDRSTTRLEAVYDTWGRDAVDLKFFLNTKDELQSDGMPIVTVPRSASKWDFIMSVLTYVSDHLVNEYSWFVMTSDDVYLNNNGLKELFLQLNPASNLYLGQPVVPVSQEEKAQSFSYCNGDSIILSQSVLTGIVKRNQLCVLEDEVEWDHRLSICAKRILNTQCGEGASNKVKKYFMLDMSSGLHTLSNDDDDILKYITISGLQDIEQLYGIHYLFKLKEYHKMKEEVLELNDQVKSMCQTMPQSILDDDKIEEQCNNLKLKPFEPEDNEEEDDNADSLTVPVSKFHPHNRFQVQPWNYFDAINIYEDESNMPRRSLRTYKYHSIELQKALQEAVKAASRQHHAKLRFKKIINGYVRHNALVGNEYIIDARFVEARHPRRKVEKRIKLLRPLASSYIVQPSKSNSSETIHFVVPLTNVNNRLSDFLQMYERLALITKENVHLVLSVYGENDIKLVTQNVSIYLKRYPKAEITVVPGSGEFSRGKALDLGMSSLNDNDLAFFCDIDMTIDRQFLKKCRRNTIQASSVYYPEVFKLYNRKYVYRKSWHPRRYSISREQGHWGYYAYGMLCMFKSDYRAIGGLDIGMVGWGGEDVDLYERVLKSGLDVLRSPDTSLMHRWHSKSCKMQSSEKMLEHCLMSQAEVLADRRELARYIFDMQGLEEEYRDVVTTTTSTLTEKMQEEQQPSS